MDFGIDKSDIYQFLPIFLLIGWMMFVQNYVKVYHPELEQIAGWMGMALIFVSMFAITFVYEYMAGTYPYVEAICNGYPNNKLRFYIRELEADQPIEAGYYGTTIIPNWGLSHPKIKGKVETLYIHHRGLWAQRAGFHPGRAMFYGESIRHPAVTNVVLQEIAIPNIERVKGEPVYELVWGNMDETSNPIINDKYKSWLKGKKTVKPSNTQDATLPSAEANGISHDDKMLMVENQRLNRINRELKRRSMSDHSVRLATEETSDLIKNELGATLEIPTKFMAAVVRFVLALWEAFGGIDNVVKTWGKGKVTMTKWISLTILGIAVLIFFYMNPAPVQRMYEWLSMGNNQIFVLLFGAIAAAGIYLYSRKRK